MLFAGYFTVQQFHIVSRSGSQVSKFLRQCTAYPLRWTIFSLAYFSNPLYRPLPSSPWHMRPLICILRCAHGLRSTGFIEWKGTLASEPNISRQTCAVCLSKCPPGAVIIQHQHEHILQMCTCCLSIHHLHKAGGPTGASLDHQSCLIMTSGFLRRSAPVTEHRYGAGTSRERSQNQGHDVLCQCPLEAAAGDT